MAFAVRFTANFDANLESIRAYLDQVGTPAAFDELLRDLFDHWIPNLVGFPQIGRVFLQISPTSVEGRARHHRVATLAGADTVVREYISGDYLLLYAVRRSTIFLLSIRHHRQLSFDLRGHWQ
jgi:plasmid stabilization system protein ParE